MAQKICQEVGLLEDAEHVPEERLYSDIAERLHLCLHIFHFSEQALVRSIVNPDGDTIVRLLYTTTGGQSERDGSGHFDFLADSMLWQEAAKQQFGHAGWGA